MALIKTHFRMLYMTAFILFTIAFTVAMPEIIQEALAASQTLAEKDFKTKERLEEPQEGHTQGSRLAQKNNQHPHQLGSPMHHFADTKTGTKDARNRVLEAKEHEP